MVLWIVLIALGLSVQLYRERNSAPFPPPNANNIRSFYRMVLGLLYVVWTRVLEWFGTLKEKLRKPFVTTTEVSQTEATNVVSPDTTNISANNVRNSVPEEERYSIGDDDAASSVYVSVDGESMLGSINDFRSTQSFKYRVRKWFSDRNISSNASTYQSFPTEPDEEDFDENTSTQEVSNPGLKLKVSQSWSDLKSRIHGALIQLKPGQSIPENTDVPEFKEDIDNNDSVDSTICEGPTDRSLYVNDDSLDVNDASLPSPKSCDTISSYRNV